MLVLRNGLFGKSLPQTTVCLKSGNLNASRDLNFVKTNVETLKIVLWLEVRIYIRHTCITRVKKNLTSARLNDSFNKRICIPGTVSIRHKI